VIAGEKAHTPRKNAAVPVKPEKRSGNLLVDIQAKLVRARVPVMRVGRRYLT